MLSKALIQALVAAGVLCCATAQAELPAGYKMQLLTENYPPFNMAVDGKNFATEDRLQGIAVDVVREMYRRAGIDYEMTLRFPWAKIYQMALDYPDYGVFVTVRSVEREPLFKWVGPFAADAWVLLAKADSPISLNRLEEAKAYRVGAYKGDVIAEQLQAEGVPLSESFRDQENVLKLQSGQIDLWATGDPSGRYLAKQEGVTGLKSVLRVEGGQLFLALNRQTPDEVVERLQAALDEMRAEGVVDQAMSRYLE